MSSTRHQNFATRRRRRWPIAVATLAAGLSATTLPLGTAGASSAHSASSVVISTSVNSTYGTILVSGHTLYTLKPIGSGCTSAKCLKFWPQVLLPKGVKKAVAGAGVNAAKLGTIKVAAGLQVTYGGKALYWFSKDTRNGQVTGNVKDPWGWWSVVVTKAKKGGGGTTTTSPGGGGIGF